MMAVEQRFLVVLYITRETLFNPEKWLKLKSALCLAITNLLEELLRSILTTACLGLFSFVRSEAGRIKKVKLFTCIFGYVITVDCLSCGLFSSR